MFRKLKTSEWFHPDGFPIAVERRNPQVPFGPHGHEFAEVVLVTGGRGVHIVGRESWPLGKGDVFVISGSRTHDYRDLQQLCLINILFQPEKLPLQLADLATLPGYHALFNLEPAWRRRHQYRSRLHLTPRELDVAVGWADDLDAELRTRRPGFGFMATAVFMQLIGYLSRCYGRARNTDSRSLLRIGKAISHLETRYAEPVDLDALAGIAQMSRRSFLRTFQAATGSTPIAYLIQLRISRAASLLRQCPAPVTEIAFQVGFQDSNYFTRQFTKVMGLSPRVYRQRNQPKERG
jgi:AraC family L-rhamnose operon transcriptional activator RhaR/AraC family L-rhamnose operon regulatory protein RhaS